MTPDHHGNEIKFFPEIAILYVLVNNVHTCGCFRTFRLLLWKGLTAANTGGTLTCFVSTFLTPLFWDIEG